jgi:hypothetical protein
MSIFEPTTQQLEILAANAALQSDARALESEIAYRKRHIGSDSELTERLRATGLTSPQLLARLRDNLAAIKKLNLPETCGSLVPRR